MISYLTLILEKINKLDEKIKQLQAQKNSLIAREKEKERKARTKRLIEIGAIFDSIGIDLSLIHI